jgi:hypothetical protein
MLLAKIENKKLNAHYSRKTPLFTFFYQAELFVCSFLNEKFFPITSSPLGFLRYVGSGG